MESQKKTGGSRLPMFSSRIKPPQPIKRARSPDESHTSKRSRLESSGNGLRSQASTGSLHRTTSSTNVLRTNTSTGNLHADIGSARNTNKALAKPVVETKPTVMGRTTAVVRPTTKTGATIPSRSAATQNVRPQAPPKKPVGQAVTVTAKPPSGGGGKKRAAWDLKGRLQDMEEAFRERERKGESLASMLEMSNQRIAMLESQNSHLSGTVAEKEHQTTEDSQKIGELRVYLRDAEANLETTKRKLQQEIEDINFTKCRLERQKESLEGEIAAGQQEINGLKSTVAQLTSAQAGISAELTATKLNLEQSLQAGREKDEEIGTLKATVQRQLEEIEEFKNKQQDHETERRKLHNTIQELKGNIRVFCRVRPLIGNELLGSDGTIPHIHFPNDDDKVLELEKLDVALNESCLNATQGGRNGNKYQFSFDRVFSPETSQQEVFEEISQLVQSALDGYNVCIFAYGQTGSGKTHTMEGSSDKDPGMIPRAVKQIFDTMAELQSRGWQYEMEASFLEIYNETIRDLLGNGKDDMKHEIKLTGKKSSDVLVTNLTLVPIQTEYQIFNLLKKASENRSVAETRCNDQSSRSHSVFRLKLLGTNQKTEETCQGTLNLVDLAGSERLKDSGSEGQRLKETQAINKSLSNLGNVIMALGNKENHIPYRNSKLTFLLQNSLGGNSKTLMFVNVSPKEECFAETLNSLRFATNVNQCNIGTAQRKK